MFGFIKNNTYVYLYGSESVNWSINSDYLYTKKILNEVDWVTITKNPFKAHVFYFVWWNQSLRYLKILKYLKKKIVVVVTNDLDHQIDSVKSASKYIDLWVCSNQKQIKTLNQLNCRYFYHPFYVDEKVFHNLPKKKYEICNELKISYTQFENKILIGSFQRDTQGGCLTIPKWQKNPELLVKCLNNIANRNIHVILAGPRRHWIVNQLTKKRIPFTFIGCTPQDGKDDIIENNLPNNIINLLYNLIDIYVVSSKSEGGPKAVPECILTKTILFSTNVGFAPDLLNSEQIFQNQQQFLDIFESYISCPEIFNYNMSRSYNYVSHLYKKENAQKRLSEIIRLSTQ